MRGDSLRDLYAKALALVGLGLLAGIGALVDYWPARILMPRVDGLAVAPVTATARPFTDVDIPEPGDTRASTVMTAAARPTVSPALFDVPAAGLPIAYAMAAPIASESLVTFGQPPVALVAPPVATATDVPASLVALSEPLADEDLIPRFMAPASDAVTSDDAGFFASATGLAKKAGSSILSGSTKAGASIVDGLGFVGRTIKKLKFF